MDELVFIHIPKTAGTSFRVGAEQYFGPEKVCFDYGPKAAETSECVLRMVYRELDFWSFGKTFRENGFRCLTGHIPANKYTPLFGVEQMVTFFRDPLQRIVSEYKHFVRLHGYTDDFQTFYRTPQFVNRQIKSFQGLPWTSLGFIGLTEKYSVSLQLLNSKYGIEVPLLETNINKASINDIYELSEDDEAEICRLNAQEIIIYRKVCELFGQRTMLAESAQPFVRGILESVNGDVIKGWACYDNTDEMVRIEVSKNGTLIGVAEAKGYRPFLKQIGTRRGGYCGFSQKTTGLRSGDTVECRVAETGQPLVGSPYRIAGEDLNC